jgi:hypothetical protein
MQVVTEVTFPPLLQGVDIVSEAEVVATAGDKFSWKFSGAGSLFRSNV